MNNIIRPDFGAQFRDPPSTTPYVYMNGVSASCGRHPSLPKHHRWGPWQGWTIKANGNVYWDRTCKMCALVSDPHWGEKPPSKEDGRS